MGRRWTAEEDALLEDAVNASWMNGFRTRLPRDTDPDEVDRRWYRPDRLRAVAQRTGRSYAAVRKRASLMRLTSYATDRAISEWENAAHEDWEYADERDEEWIRSIGREPVYEQDPHAGDLTLENIAVSFAGFFRAMSPVEETEFRSRLRANNAEVRFRGRWSERCSLCGDDFATNDLKRKYCSHGCADEANRQRARERKRRERASALPRR